MTEFITTKENETKQNKTESPSVEKRLDEISAKLSNVLTRSDTDIIKNIIKESLEGLKEQLLGSVVKQIEILESNLFDQAKELDSLKQQLSAKDQEINILKQSDHSKNQTYEAVSMTSSSMAAGKVFEFLASHLNQKIKHRFKLLNTRRK
ncbi:hypothetical protein DPMN_049846 [Dreissena polymorpha]|uniref:Uncharacterized protein n=1 Tax=Dreissena polymorpha TaxID=45954 RepID=A0A9D4HLP3_DREPO|nr:hypothetical protein DPMN_049846 [Dreissena polymorpha]